MSDTFTPLTDVVERLQKVDHVMYTTGWRSNSLASDSAREITRLRTLLSEAEQREKDARREGWAFAEGDLVRKKSGSWWEGRVVGTYSTEQTPRGYAVQLDKPNGPVQIYPESALERALQSEER